MDSEDLKSTQSIHAYSNADARHCARRVLQYVESLKDAEADWDGNKSSFIAPGYLLFSWLLDVYTCSPGCPPRCSQRRRYLRSDPLGWLPISL
jgi:hypothetical protein